MVDTVLLLHFDGNFKDSSSYNHTVIPWYGATTSTVEKKFGTSSFLGGMDIYETTRPYLASHLRIPASTLFDFGIGDFTIDWWMYKSDFTYSYYDYILGGYGITQNDMELFTWQGVQLHPLSNGFEYKNYPSSVVLPHTWTHIAVVRYGNNIKVYYNGVEKFSTPFSATVNLTAHGNDLWIGGSEGYGADGVYGVYPFYGYIDELRISSGARWTNAFIPSDTPYPDPEPPPTPVVVNKRPSFIVQNVNIPSYPCTCEWAFDANPVNGTSVVLPSANFVITPTADLTLGTHILYARVITDATYPIWSEIGSAEILISEDPVPPEAFWTKVYADYLVNYGASNGLQHRLASPPSPTPSEPNMAFAATPALTGDFTVTFIVNPQSLDNFHRFNVGLCIEPFENHYWSIALAVSGGGMNYSQFYYKQVISYPFSSDVGIPLNRGQSYETGNGFHTGAGNTPNTIIFKRVAGVITMQRIGEGFDIYGNSFTYTGTMYIYADLPFPDLVELGRVDSVVYTIPTPTDVQDEYTSLLLHMDGDDNGTVFSDSSTYINEVLAYNGAVTSATQKKFGTASFKCDYTTLANLKVTASDKFDFGTGEFTIDFWAYPLSTRGDANTIMSNDTDGILLDCHYGMRFHPYGTTTSVLVNNVWTHVAIVRVGTTLKFYYNGVEQSSAAFSGAINLSSGSKVWIGARPYGNGYAFHGYIDEFRISKGIARWSADFSANLPGAY